MSQPASSLEMSMESGFWLGDTYTVARKLWYDAQPVPPSGDTIMFGSGFTWAELERAHDENRAVASSGLILDADDAETWARNWLNNRNIADPSLQGKIESALTTTEQGLISAGFEDFGLASLADAVKLLTLLAVAGAVLWGFSLALRAAGK